VRGTRGDVGNKKALAIAKASSKGAALPSLAILARVQRSAKLQVTRPLGASRVSTTFVLPATSGILRTLPGLFSSDRTLHEYGYPHEHLVYGSFYALDGFECMPEVAE
jgi:hypothetical protein